jgi:hypothetical protein
MKNDFISAAARGRRARSGERDGKVSYYSEKKEEEEEN